MDAKPRHDRNHARKTRAGTPCTVGQLPGPHIKNLFLPHPLLSLSSHPKKRIKSLELQDNKRFLIHGRLYYNKCLMQVVTLATYVFFIFTIIGRQKIDGFNVNKVCKFKLT
jgi:hypothetical protein